MTMLMNVRMAVLNRGDVASAARGGLVSVVAMGSPGERGTLIIGDIESRRGYDRSTMPPPAEQPKRTVDRDGEMTGAITIRYVLVMPPVMVWCVFIGPLFAGVWVTVGVGLAMSVVLTAISGPLSRRIWTRVSRAMDRSTF
jgi:hypothetical protein